MKHKKLWRGLALLLALSLLVGLGLFANAFVGNPVSRWLVQRNAEAYLAEHYGGTDCALGEVGYSFKDGSYWVDVTSPSSEDTHFTLNYDFRGHLGYDSYESMVTSGENTLRRLEDQYRALCRTILEAPSFPYKLWIAGGSLHDAVYQSLEVESIPKPGARPEPLLLEELELDRQYDIPALGARHGILTVYVETDERTAEHGAAVLLDIKRIMEEGGAPFAVVEFNLEPVRGEDGAYAGPGMSFAPLAWDEIYEEGMEERMQAAYDAQTAYFAAMDALREKEEAALKEE